MQSSSPDKQAHTAIAFCRRETPSPQTNLLTLEIVTTQNRKSHNAKIPADLTGFMPA